MIHYLHASALLLVLICAAAADEIFFVAHLANIGARFPKSDFDSWVRTPGELTQVGMRQLYLLGRELRQQYVINAGLLSERFNSYELSLRAAFSNWTTTSASAYSFVRGLYPPGTGYSLSDFNIERAIPPNNETNYTEYQKELRDAALPNYFDTVPVMIYGGDADLVLSAAVYCDNLPKIVKQQVDSSSALKNRRAYLEKKGKEGVFAELSKLFNEEVATIKDALMYRDYFISAKYYAVILKEKLSEEGMKQLNEMYAFVKYEEYYADSSVAKVVSNGALSEIKTILSASMTGKPDRTKMVSYIVEDNNIFAILRLLYQNLTTGYVEVPFASSLQFEVIKNGSSNADAGAEVQYKVKVVYNGKALTWPNGQLELPLKEFNAWIDLSILPQSDFMKACKGTEIKPSKGDTTWLVFGLIVCGLIIAMMVIVCIYVLKGGKEDELGKPQTDDLKDEDMAV